MPIAPIRTEGASAARRYGVATFASLVTLAVRLALGPLLDDTAPLLLFILPITFSAWYGGPRAGLFATALCVLLGTYFVLPPVSSLVVASPEDVVRLIILVIGGVWASLMFDAFRLARRRIDASSRELAHSRAHLAGIIETARDAIITLDADGRITLFNASAEQLFGYHAPEVIGQPLARLIPTPLPPMEGRPNEASGPAHGEGQSGRPGRAPESLSARRRGGEEFPAETSITRFTVEGERFTTIILRDVSERRRGEEERRALERRLRESQRLESLGVLAGGVAHDFNNLLAGIIGNAELALEELPPGASGREELGQIQQIARRAASLTQQMLAYAGQGHIVVAPTDLGRLVADSLPLLESSLPPTATLSVELAHSLEVEADESQIRQALTHLVVNAGEALGEQPGQVRIALEAVERLPAEVLHASPQIPDGPLVALSVADTGRGIAPEHLGRIFEPFFSTKFTGRGLGLAVVLGIVLGHHGALSVQSASGSGTTVTLFFPRAANRPGAPPAPAAQAGGRVRTLLVVDDEESVPRIARRVLESDRVRVLAAADGHEAIELFARLATEIDVVLLDLAMPEVSGQETWRRVRSIRPDVPIILMSGYSDDKIGALLPEADLTAVLPKPFGANELRAAVSRWLDESG